MYWFADFITIPWVYWTVCILYTITILGVTVVVVSENRNPVKSLAWITVLLVVPVIGLILYIVFGRNIQTKRMISRRNRRKIRRLGAAKPSQPIQYDGREELKQQANLIYSVCGSALYHGNQVELFNNGKDKFDALLADIAAARKYINIQYYIIVDDQIGHRIIDALCAKAIEGVKVRIIYDHVGSFKLSRRATRKMAAAGIEAYPFFKVVFPLFGTRINWRNHRKLAVIDGEIGYIGGMNIADRYINGGPHFNHWRDLHLRLRGPAVGALQQSFAIDWNFMGKPLITEEAGTTVQTSSPVSMQLAVGGPTSQLLNMTLILQHAISIARECVYIQTPYFIPSEGLLHALQMAALGKVDVRIMMPYRSDSDMLRWASFSYVQECLRTGVKIYLYKGGMLHSKALIVDDEFATVGSTNFDFRSFEHNFEANMIIYSAEFNKQLKDQFRKDQQECERIRPETWKKRPLGEKALESFMRLFSPIL